MNVKRTWCISAPSADSKSGKTMAMAAAAGLFVLQLLTSAGTVSGSAEFTLEGSQNSYAQLRKWNAGLNGSLQIEFRSEQPNGLLVYTDDGGKFDFFELKLVEGAMRLRFNLGAGAQILTVGRNLSDGHWHTAVIKRSGEQTSLTVDRVTVSRASRGREFAFGSLSANSPVYVGGLPVWYGAELNRLALPSVLFEPRFRGDIRNVIYSDAINQPNQQQEMLESQVTLNNYKIKKEIKKKTSRIPSSSQQRLPTVAAAAAAVQRRQSQVDNESIFSPPSRASLSLLMGLTMSSILVHVLCYCTAHNRKCNSTTISNTAHITQCRNT